MNRKIFKLHQQQLQRFFLGKNSLPEYFQYIATFTQFALYLTTISHSFTIQWFIFDENLKSSQFLIFIAICFILRGFYNLSLAPLVYIQAIAIIFLQQLSGSTIILATSTFFLLLIDFTSNISFDFSESNPKSESLNWIKILHYLVLSSGVIQNILFKNSILILTIQTATFLALFLVKRVSLMKNECYKQFILRSYLLIIFRLIFNLITSVSNWTLPSLLDLTGPILVSQGLFYIYKTNHKKISINSLYSCSNYLKLSFQIVRYYRSEQFSQNLENQINQFIFEEDNDKFRNKSQRNRQIAHKIINLLEKDQMVLSKILIAQIHLILNQNLLQSKKQIQSLKTRLSWYEFVFKILIYRLQQRICQKYTNNFEQLKFHQFEEIEQVDEFKNILIKTSIKYIQFYSLKINSLLNIEKLRKSANTIVYLQNKIKERYEDFKYRCCTLSILYASFLFEVQRNYNEGNYILTCLQFPSKEEINLNLNQKLFVRLSLQHSQPLLFKTVGSNVNRLLGFFKKQLQNQKYQILLPEFFRIDHNNMIRNILQNNFSDMYLYKRQTIIRNGWGSYSQCTIMLRLEYEMFGDLSMIGFIHIPKFSRYNLNHYFFANEKKEIIQHSIDFPFLQKTEHTMDRYLKIPSSENQHQYQSISNQQILKFHPIFQFNANSTKIYFLTQLKQNSFQETHLIRKYELQKLKKLELIQNIKIIQHDDKIMKRYSNKMKIVDKKIYHICFKLLILLSILLIISLFAGEIILTNAVNLKAGNQQYVIDASNQFMIYYNSSFDIAMSINYLDLNYYHGYINKNMNPQLINSSLKLQSANQYLKIFNGPLNVQPSSLVPGLSYNKTNYELIQEIISLAYLMEQFQDQTMVSQFQFIESREVINTILTKTITNYRANFFNLITNLTQDDTFYNNVSLSLILILTFFIFLIGIRLQYQLRTSQLEAIQLVCSLQLTKEQISLMKDFIFQLTSEQIYSGTQRQGESRDENILTNSVTENIFLEQSTKTQFALRQTGRNFIENSFNKEEIIVSNKDNIQKNDPLNEIKLKICKRNKTIIFTYLLIILSIWSLGLTNYLLNNKILQINEVTSSNSIIVLYRSSGYYSLYVGEILNLINLKSLNIQFSTAPFQSFSQSQIQFFSNYIIPVFQESNLPEFGPFKSALTQIQYQEMCLFMNCSNFISEINLIYTSTIISMMNSSTTIIKLLKDNNFAQISSELQNGSVKNQIDMLIYTESIIRNWMIDLCQLYISCYNNYINALKASKMQFIDAILSISIIGSFLFLVFVFYIYINQRQLSDIIKIVKVSSSNDQYEQEQKQNEQ